MSLHALASVAAGNGGVVTRQVALACGVSSQQLTKGVRAGQIARIARGVYAVGPIDERDPRGTALSWNVVLSFESAAAWWGIELPATVRKLHVTAPRNRGRRSDRVAGVRLHRAMLRPDDTVWLRGARVTTPLRTALDIARHASLEDAVAIIDSFMRAKLLRYDDFVQACWQSQGPGRRRIQLVAQLVDPASGSILESLTRVLLRRHAVPPPHTQFRLSDETGWFGYLDFAWPALRVALECDGYEFHAERGAFQKDRRRWSALSRGGWRCGVVTWFDVTADPSYVVELVRDLLALAATAHKGDI